MPAGPTTPPTRTALPPLSPSRAARRLGALPARAWRRCARRLARVDRRRAARLFLAVFGVTVLLCLLLPSSAQAGITDAIEDAIQSVLGKVFEKIMSGLFGRIQGEITQALVSWIVAIPNFDPSAQQQYVAGPAKSNIDAARQATSMLALGGLSAVMTLSVIRYWISGLSMRGAGGIEAFEGFSRTLLAVGLILLWPEGFRLFVALTNSATHTLLEWPSVKDNISGLWGWTTVLTAGAFSLAAPVAVVITIIIFVGFALLMLALVLMKIMLTAGTALIYVLMPLALVLWPLPELAWIARLVGRAFVVCLLIPLTWSVIFITFGALGADFFTLSGQGGLLDKMIIKPLVAIAMLSLSITIPRSLGKAALLGAITSTGGQIGGGGAGFFGRMASSLAARRADAALAQHVPAQWGGRMQQAPGMSGAAQTALQAAGVRFAGAGAATGLGGASGGGRGGARGGQNGGAPQNGGGPGGPQTGGGQRGRGQQQPQGGQQQNGNGRGPAGRPQGGNAGPGQGQRAGQGRPPLADGAPIPYHHDPAALRQLKDEARAWRSNDGGPSEAATWGALGELRPEDQARVADEAQRLSGNDFQDAMLTRASNPAFSDTQQGAWFTLGAAGRDQVREVVAFEQGGGFSTSGGDDEPWIPPHSDRGNGGPPPSSPTPQPPTSAR
jgi:hypothetical protein